MTSTLLLQLKQFYEEDPNDPFNLYALAIEYLKSDPLESGRMFETLLVEHSKYLPTYYQAGAFFSQIGNFQKAIAIYEKGIDLAKSSGQEKTRMELLNAYKNVLDEMEE